jgi:hypothetical protein
MFRVQKGEVHNKEEKRTIPKAKVEIRKNKMAMKLCQKKKKMAIL